MQSTVEIRRKRKRFVMDGDRFDALAQKFAATKGLKDHEIAELMDMDKTSWSLVKTGTRYVPIHVIAECIELFPGVALTDYATVVPFRAQS